MNGLILIQHGGVADGKREASRIAHVDKIVNIRTGELREHASPAAVFRSLRNAIKRDLVFATMHDFKDGRLVEDDKTRLMTAAAAELAGTGFFDRMPGRRLK